MVRNLVKYVPWKEYKPVTADLKRIYQLDTVKEGILLAKPNSIPYPKSACEDLL